MGRPKLSLADARAREMADRQNAQRQMMTAWDKPAPLPPTLVGLAGLRPAQRLVTPAQLYKAILDVLHSAPLLQHFTSQTMPCWDGWATASMIAWRLDHRISDARFAPTDPDEEDNEAWFYVPATLRAAARAGKLETRVIRPLRFSEHEEVAQIECPAYRLPGDAGYCRWYPEQPMGAVPGEEYVDPALMDSRQIRLIRAELSVMGCDIPPFLLARFEKYAKNKSGLRALR